MQLKPPSGTLPTVKGCGLTTSTIADGGLRSSIHIRLAWTPGAVSWKDVQWAPRPKMTPEKVERGRQQNRDQEPPHSTSQKRRSQYRPRDKVDSNKAIPRATGRVAKYKLGLTGPIWVSRNLFPNQTHTTHLSKQTCPGQVMIRCPG